ALRRGPADLLRGRMRYFLSLFLTLLPVLAAAVDFDEHTQRLPLGQVMDVFEDVRGDSSINEITSPALAASFRRHDQEVLNAGYSRSVFWLRVDLNYRPQAREGDKSWLLELAYPPLDHLDLYVRDDTGDYRLVQRTGDALPFGSRQIKQNNYLFELDL